ncbi:tRNA pseudouridine(38-40) synthase TruA [Simiduia sp. 21SJ11W-1]|uniref:tRNA pseudouridine(38-40) synthase TruA n=1 Tax=Simiduia sp. 21SJ11W-1 TaxID=2909669 RepID=UPI00209EA11B|nr:tRNA pseudouridine(38-40) synthase TruA [Simiduia sp. 21SJ11W-1]UTA49280.1 tRNA pseudouridine(38-40) synthase TruA [Simiduia sp. 21SJ11W-1]
MQKIYTPNCEIVNGVSLPEGVRRVALALEYHGGSFRGFQQQEAGVPTVQASLQDALSKVANEPITLVCAGRTDAEVHATNQVVHFDTRAVRSAKAWTAGVNANLPAGVAVKWAAEVPPAFHARFSARERTYRYIIFNSPMRPALQHDQLTWCREPLDVNRMRAGAKHLLGEHDFNAFRAAQCQARHPVREIKRIDLAVRGDLIIMEITANAFLHHMVRNIAGVLMRVGKGWAETGWVGEVLASKDRTQAAETAPPYGLYLVHVAYPQEFNLPQFRPGPCFLAEKLGDFSR